MAKAELSEAVKELWYWQYGTNPTNFSSRLFELMQKADRENLARLGHAFPVEFAAYSLWMDCEDQDALFAEFGFNRPAVRP
jgi:hypothetical protein